MKKIAVIFPGIGYTAQKPLLYYTASAAQDEDYQLLKLDYGEDIHTFRGRKEEELKPLIEKAQERVKKQLEIIDWGQYEQILFLSKSIGTVIACWIEKELGIKAKHCLLTPIPLTIPYLEEVDGLFFAGTKDPYIKKKMIEKAAKDYPQKTGEIFKDCNHSLERPGHTAANVKNVKKVVKKLKKMLREPKAD